jgi:hypothetical protein
VQVDKLSNSYAGMFAILPAAMEEASKAKVANDFFLDTVNKDIKPVVATPYDTVNFNYASSTYTPTNVLATALTLGSVTATPAPVQLNQHPAFWFPLPDFDMARTPSDLRALFVDEAVKKMANYIDNYIASLITTANFSTYTPIAGVTANTVVDAQMSSAWATLANNDIPVRDEASLFLAVTPSVYGNILTQASWTQQSYVGEISSEIRRTAILGRQWGALCDYDRFIPLSGTSKNQSLLFHKYAIGLAARLLPQPKVGGVISQTVYYRGLPIRFSIDYNQQQLAETIAVDTLFGAAVIRPDFGIMIESL